MSRRMVISILLAVMGAASAAWAGTPRFAEGNVAKERAAFLARVRTGLAYCRALKQVEDRGLGVKMCYTWVRSESLPAEFWCFFVLSEERRRWFNDFSRGLALYADDMNILAKQTTGYSVEHGEWANVDWQGVSAAIQELTTFERVDKYPEGDPGFLFLRTAEQENEAARSQRPSKTTTALFDQHLRRLALTFETILSAGTGRVSPSREDAPAYDGLSAR